MNYFAAMTVAAPLTLKDLDACITLLKEKRTYYETLPKDA